MNHSKLATDVGLSLGGKIRQRRKAKKMTLTELSHECNISPSFLSQIERDQAKPSVGTLHAIADKLGVKLAEFFQDTDGSSDNGAGKQAEPLAQIVRGNHRKVLVYPNSGIRNELVSPDLQRAIQMMWTVLPPGETTGDVPLVHEGEECGLVIQGRVGVWVGDEYYELGPGDAIYQKSTIPHRSQNLGDTDAIVVVAITPPSF